MNRPPPTQADIDRVEALYSPIFERLERGEITQAQADAEMEATMHRDVLAFVDARMVEHDAARRRTGWIGLVLVLLVVFAASGWVILTHL